MQITLNLITKKSKVNNMLEDINTKFDSIKAKLENILNGSNSGN